MVVNPSRRRFSELVDLDRIPPLQGVAGDGSFHGLLYASGKVVDLGLALGGADHVPGSLTSVAWLAPAGATAQPAVLVAVR